MRKLHYEIDIKAPAQRVWEVMIGKETFADWSDFFNPGGGSYYEGSWEQGSEIRFIGPDEQGKLYGMISRVAESRPYEFISLEMVGEIADGEDDRTSERVKQWAGSHENYRFSEQDGVTHLTIDFETDHPDEAMLKSFEEAWPKALQRLKELAEK